jgi:hypothetical protein
MTPLGRAAGRPLRLAAPEMQARCSSRVAEVEHRAVFLRVVVHLRHRAISPTGETPGFAAPDRSGCALSGERHFTPPPRAAAGRSSLRASPGPRQRRADASICTSGGREDRKEPALRRNGLPPTALGRRARAGDGGPWGGGGHWNPGSGDRSVDTCICGGCTRATARTTRTLSAERGRGPRWFAMTSGTTSGTPAASGSPSQTGSSTLVLNRTSSTLAQSRRRGVGERLHEGEETAPGPPPLS